MGPHLLVRGRPVRVHARERDGDGWLTWYMDGWDNCLDQAWLAAEDAQAARFGEAGGDR